MHIASNTTQLVARTADVMLLFTALPEVFPYTSYDFLFVSSFPHCTYFKSSNEPTNLYTNIKISGGAVYLSSVWTIELYIKNNRYHQILRTGDNVADLYLKLSVVFLRILGLCEGELSSFD